jgi:hypothetical protein
MVSIAIEIWSHDHKMASSAELPFPSPSRQYSTLSEKETLRKSLCEYVKRAKELLLFRDFQTCLDTTELGIAHAKVHAEDDG